MFEKEIKELFELSWRVMNETDFFRFVQDRRTCSFLRNLCHEFKMGVGQGTGRSIHYIY